MDNMSRPYIKQSKSSAWLRTCGRYGFLCCILGLLPIMCIVLVHGRKQFSPFQDMHWFKTIAGTDVRVYLGEPIENSRPKSLKPENFVYVYEKNMKTGSASWAAMMLDAKGSHNVIPCKGTAILNTLTVNKYELKDRDAVMPCRQNNLTSSQLNRSSSEYQTRGKLLRPRWALDQMGYSGPSPLFDSSQACPISEAMRTTVGVAVEDTYLPISHDLSCMSRKMLKDMVGLEVLEELKLNLRSGRKEVEWDMDVSCIDIAIAKAMTVKLVYLFDGTDLSSAKDWRERARRIEASCASNAKAF